MATLRFNLRTKWPVPSRMPEGTDALIVTTNGMNPGLGVRELHRQGITGRGVNVAVMDYYTFADSPGVCREVRRLPGLERGGSRPAG